MADSTQKLPRSPSIFLKTEVGKHGGNELEIAHTLWYDVGRNVWLSLLTCYYTGVVHNERHAIASRQLIER